MGARVYDPYTGTFTQPDPIQGGGATPYGYTDGDPVNETDLGGNTPSLWQATMDPLGSLLGGIFGGGTQRAVDSVENTYVKPTLRFAVIGAASDGLGEIFAPVGDLGDGALLKPGPFAGDSVSADSTAQRFSSSVRSDINRIGDDTGCHSCGASEPGTKTGNWVPDHQPVSALNDAGSGQRLYPQCLACSRAQGLAVARRIRTG
jgi:uncharacterized protein RhaS with RHS repeats